MNCKEGDLAVIVGARNPENLGKVVSCERFLGDMRGLPLGEDPSMVFSDVDTNKRVWRISEKVCWSHEGEKIAIPFYTDDHLLPISSTDDGEVTTTCNVPVAEAL